MQSCELDIREAGTFGPLREAYAFDKEGTA